MAKAKPAALKTLIKATKAPKAKPAALKTLIKATKALPAPFVPTIQQPAPAPTVQGLAQYRASEQGQAQPTGGVYVSGVGYVFPQPTVTTQPSQVVSPYSGRRMATAQPTAGGIAPLGQAFPRNQAILAQQGVVAAGQAAMRTPQPTARTQPSQVVSPYSGRRMGTIPRQPTTPQTQPSQVVSPYSGRSMASDAFRPAIAPAVTKHLDYLDQLRETDPGRASEVARFQSATIGRAQPEAALATNVFFTEKAIFDLGILPRNASEQVWDVIAFRMGLGMNGAQLLRDQGYVPVGGGLWYLGALGGGGGGGMGAAISRNLGTGGGFENGDSGGRFLSNASAGLFNWRIGA